jgi:hypothetical protein
MFLYLIQATITSIDLSPRSNQSVGLHLYMNFPPKVNGYRACIAGPFMQVTLRKIQFYRAFRDYLPCVFYRACGKEIKAHKKGLFAACKKIVICCAFFLRVRHSIFSLFHTPNKWSITRFFSNARQTHVFAVHFSLMHGKLVSLSCALFYAHDKVFLVTFKFLLSPKFNCRWKKFLLTLKFFSSIHITFDTSW